MERVLNLNLSHVKVILLPPNTTSVIQPLDAGIIAALKCHYPRLQAGRVLDLDDLRRDDIYKVYILEVIRWIISQWMILPSALIANCWLKTPLICTLSTRDAEVEDKMEEEKQALTLEVVRWCQRKTIT